MSTCFEVYPTNGNIPEMKNIITKASAMFDDFLKFHRIEKSIDISAPEFITVSESTYNTIEINQSGSIYLFYIRHDDLCKEMWDDELKNNPRAEMLANSVLKNRQYGYSWEVKRTAGQPAIASLFYGFVAIAVAQETDGFIYSDDGAWSYELFPTEWQNLYKEYFNTDSIKNPEIKETVLDWINILKRS